MKIIESKQECCGCRICEHICPVSAIKMILDEEGFLYPFIDKSLCEDCGLCKKVCSFIKEKVKFDRLNNSLFYAVRHKDISEILKSRSGAMFVVLSDYILVKEGVIYGAGFDKNLTVIHKRATSKKDRDEFRGSKYVQSDLGSTFKLIELDLKSNRYVLFSGTPCQCSALYSFLEYTDTSIEKLFVCDLVCHGAPSPKVYSDFIHYCEKKNHAKVISINLRDKSMGWNEHLETVTYENKKKETGSIYRQLYYSNMINRPSCSNCRFASTDRYSDITLADYWGIERLSKTFNYDNKGASLVIVNTKKGKDLFDKIIEKIFYLESSLEKSVQPNLKQATPMSKKRTQFWSDYNRKGFGYILKKYYKVSKLKRLFKKIISLKKHLAQVND